jgi:AraC-like DNA-binding protein
MIAPASAQRLESTPAERGPCRRRSGSSWCTSFSAIRCAACFLPQRRLHGTQPPGGDKVIHVDLPWDPAMLEQRIVRAHRTGQKNRPEIAAVARELGLSDRTLQRRIIDDGATFRQLLLEVRQELAHEYLNRPEMDVPEVAFLLGYEDSNSFYRAFRTWEGTTPSQLRAALRRSETRQ